MRRSRLRPPLALAAALCVQAAGLPSPAAAQGPAPTQLVYSTYFGGAQEEMASEVEVDSAGNAYLAGATLSRDYPFTEVAPDERGRNFGVAVVTKLTAAGEIAYSTFLRGASFAQGLAVDAAGYAYVTGSTYGGDLATTAGALDPTYNGEEDAFVAKLDPDGNVVWATYLGGELPDAGTDLEVDDGGYVYLTGDTFSDDFPVTEGAFETERPGSYDAFVAKITPDGSELVFATYLGGSSSERGVQLTGDPTLDVDAEGRVHVAGVSNSRDFPTTSLAFGYPPRSNAFVSTLSPDGAELLFSTVIGGGAADGATDVEAGANGIYLVGNTASEDFPVSDGAFDTTFDRLSRSDDEGFVVRLLPDGTLDYATFLGGRGDEELSTIEPLDDGTVWITGSGGIGYPATSDAFDPFPPASDGASKWARLDPAGDVVVTRLDASGSGLVYSTFLGGTGYELGRDVEVAGEEVVVSGYSESHNLPTTVDAVRLTADEPAPHNMFLARLLPGGSEPCTNHGHDGADTVTGTEANDLLCGFGGADVLDGRGGNDVLYGGGGDDSVAGGGGADSVRAGGGHDAISGNAGADALFGDAGRDVIKAGTGNDGSFVGGREDQLIDGGPGNDLLVGSAFFDLLLGRGGGDVLRGRAGPDVLHGGDGHDRLVAGPGRDRCVSGRGGDDFKGCERS